MGNFYTNITLRGTEQDDVVEILNLRRRTAYVSPAIEGYTVIFDEECDNQDTDVLQSLASLLSSQLSCPALAVLNHDDDILLYKLYVDGNLIDEYNSSPAYFGPDAGPSSPVGGNAEELCHYMGSSENIREVGTILQRGRSEESGYVFEVERHEDLVSALGLPAFAVGVGYSYIEQGELPEELEKGMLKRTG